MSLFLGGTGSANELHDYEEGTFTVGFSHSSFSSQSYATYVKIGRLVYCDLYVQGVQAQNNSSSFLITGLPFNCNSTSNGMGVFGYVGSTAMSAVNLMPLVGTNNSYIYFHRQDGTGANWTNAQHRSTAWNQPMLLSVVYETES